MIPLNTIFVILLFAHTIQKRNDITIYTESLCPDCKNFFINSFASALNTTFNFNNAFSNNIWDNTEWNNTIFSAPTLKNVTEI